MKRDTVRKGWIVRGKKGAWKGARKRPRRKSEGDRREGMKRARKAEEKGHKNR